MAEIENAVLKKGSELKTGDRFTVGIDVVYIVKEDGRFYNEKEGWCIGKIRQDALCIVFDAKRTLQGEELEAFWKRHEVIEG